MWTVSAKDEFGVEHQVEVPDDETDEMFTLFRIDRHAWHYFHVLCFIDKPGYFPQLEKRT